MGREIRHVPANWDHPRQTCKHSPWRGGCDDAKANGGKCYTPMSETPTGEWFQVFETVSEGTPVTPPFAKKDEIVDLVSNEFPNWS